MPKSRVEIFLSALINGESVDIEPGSRIEKYLSELCKMGIGGAGTGSWNNLTDRPFYDETKVYYEYSEEYQPLKSVEIQTGYYAYKVSNTPLSVEELIGCELIVYTGELVSGIVSEDGLAITDTYIMGNGVISVLSDSELQGITLDTGLWVTYSEAERTHKLSKGELVPIPMKYIPDELYTEIDNRIDAYIEEALGGEY